jgi:RNA polymerase sigma-70 factor (ECF subfamily)
MLLPVEPEAPSMTAPGQHDDRLDGHRRFLWALAYRMTGSASDAEDIVQETFIRALEHPPRDTSAPWRPWLVRVAMNLSRDQLRKRRRRGYTGVWLPEPVDGDAPGAEISTAGGVEQLTPEGRLSLAESASFAFLLAIEALTPAQRAVLVLRDAFDFSVRETADALTMSESNVKTTLHRARRALENHERSRLPPSRALKEHMEEMLGRVVACMLVRDVDGLRDLLAVDARSLSDGGGVSFAARAPVVGNDKIARMYAKLATFTSDQARAEIRTINGLPAIVIDDPDPAGQNANRAVLRIELDHSGKIREIHSVLVPAKLARVRPCARGSFVTSD